MKKLFLLTSLLALVACGGGGGGGGAPAGGGSGGSSMVSAPVVPSYLGGAVTADAQNSNNNVTKMKSEVVVASNWSSPLTRASTTTVDGVTFYSYGLDDIRLYTADEVNTNQGYLNIGMDEDGRIENIEMHVGGTGAPVARVGESNQFNGPIFEYVEDEYVFSASNATELLNAVASGAGFVASGEGAGWKQVGDYWKFDTDGAGHYAHWNPDGTGDEECAINNAIDPMKIAVKKANHFDDGKWETVDGNYKYREYGDQAVYRTVETTDMTADTLASREATIKANHPGIIGHWNRVDEVMDVVTLGGDIDGAGTALQYADFGHFNPVYKTKDIDVNGGEYGAWTNVGENKVHTDGEVADGLAAEDYQLFAGGYAINGISNSGTLTPERNTSYHGKAIGRVYTSIQGDNNATRESHFAAYGITSGDGHDMAKAYTTTHATMTIGADGTQTLVMPFNSHSDTADTFYDITITKNPDTSIDMDFAGTPSETQYQLYDAESHVVAAQNTFSPGYYGVNTPSEAAGIARWYSEKDFGDGTKREYELQAAWGMKKDE